MIAKKQTVLKVMAMYGSSAVGSVLGLLTSILNTRILGTAGFGDFKFIQTVIRFVASVTTAGYFISITRLLAITNDKAYQKKLVGYSVVVLLVMGLIASVMIIIFSFIEPIYFKNGLGPTLRYFFLAGVAFLASLALFEILKGLNHIYTIVIVTIAPGALYLAVAYPLNLYGLMDLNSVLLWSYGLQLLVCIIVIFKLRPDFAYGKELIQRVREENRTNGRPVYYGSLAGVATTHIAGFSIAYFLDNTQLGFYMLALTICSPLLTVPSVMGTTFFRHFANIDRIPFKIFLFTLLISIPILLVFYVFIEDLIVFFYTERFLPSAGIAKVLIIAFLFHGLGDLVNRFLGAKGKGKLLRNAAFIVGGINVIGYPLLAYLYQMEGVISTKILASLAYFFVMLIFYRNFVKKNRYVQK